MKGVFTTKVDPAYDDLPEERYQFPRTYLRQVEATVGDWIVYYEPRRTTVHLSSRGGRKAYFATARVARIERDPSSEHFYAIVTDYLPFDRPVPFREGDHFYESGLQRADGETNKGSFGRAVRNLTDREYDLILHSGYAPIVPTTRDDKRIPMLDLNDEVVDFTRPLVERLTVRPFRDAAFAAAVKTAYQQTCAVTGIKIINGGGRAEVQAAHIQPVASDGPDSIRNGLALSGTIHWMFDRGLVSVGDDYSFLVARNRVPDTVIRLINPNGKLIEPTRPEFRPHPRFLDFHRREVFKG